MSERILRALMQLFAIVARVDEVSTDENSKESVGDAEIKSSKGREIIGSFLKSELSSSDVNKYLNIFDDFLISTIGRLYAKSGGQKRTSKSLSFSYESLNLSIRITNFRKRNLISFAPFRIHSTSTKKNTSKLSDSLKPNEKIPRMKRTTCIIMPERHKTSNMRKQHLLRESMDLFTRFTSIALKLYSSVTSAHTNFS